jgi:beta-barrel assembly-enhancing protease
MRRLWCVAVAMLAVWGAQGQERQPGQGVNFYSKDKEIALGQALAADYRQKTTPLDNGAASDYVKRVGAKLAAQFPGWKYQIETIREDQGGATHEPAAFPGGFIFVSVDLIAAAQNEAEFAGMLAHAMAHVEARHATREATRNELGQTATQTAAVSMPGRSSGLQVPISMLAFQRANEVEADYLAVKAMAAAGYDPAGLASYVGRVQPAPGRGAVPAVFATLPPRDERVAHIQAEIGKLPAGAYEASDAFARVQAEVKALVAAPTTIKK